MSLKDYYLDTKSVFNLDTHQQERIFDLYHSLASSSLPPDAAESYFNTLIKSGYLKNRVEENRAEKIEAING